ncbi:MAG: hypothetical protein WD928_06350 [Gammaproteobacteria bacterium]
MTPCKHALLGLSFAAATLIAAPAALAASATASAIFDGIADIRTTGTASVVFSGFEILEAAGSITGGTVDPANDGMSFDVGFSASGSGEALNSGIFGASSFATTASPSLATAFTFVDAELLYAGTGEVEIDLAYMLDVDEFGNLPSAFANAGIFATNFFAFEETEIEVLGTAPGTFDAASGVLTLSFFIDIDPLLEPMEDILTVHTFANASASPVPVPAALWLLSPALVGLLGLRRRTV